MDTTKSESTYPFHVKWVNPDGGWAEGPLSVLWGLIESYKIDIFEVSLSRITEDFLNFLRLSKNLSIELGSEFIKMAAHLVYLKSRALLPNPGFDEIETEPALPKELVEKLLEHKKFQIAAQKLSEIDLIQSAVFQRESTQFIIPFPEDENWLDLDLIDLISAFNKILTKESVKEQIPDVLIAQSNYSISDKISQIESLLEKNKEIYFSELFDKDEPEILEIVYSFLAILEIVKLRKIHIKQHKMFGDIKIFLAV
jgi:segregation and condensation protein A